MMGAELFAMSGVDRLEDAGLTIHGIASSGKNRESGLGGIVGILCILFLVPLTVYLVYNNVRRAMARNRRKQHRANRRRSR